jgi:hypothetical protein
VALARPRGGSRRRIAVRHAMSKARFAFSAISKIEGQNDRLRTLPRVKCELGSAGNDESTIRLKRLLVENSTWEFRGGQQEERDEPNCKRALRRGLCE